jgi:hypothetical protein
MRKNIDGTKCLREGLEGKDFAVAAAVAGQVIGAAVAWLQQLGIITVLLSVTVGATMTYWIQVSTQKSNWKREILIRDVDNLYGPLLNEVGSIRLALEKGKFLKHFIPATETWTLVTTTYYRFLLDDDLRQRLVGFYEKVDVLRSLEFKAVTIVINLFHEKLKERFGEDFVNWDCMVLSYNKDGTWQGSSIDLNDFPLGINPIQATRERMTESDHWGLEVKLVRRGTSTWESHTDIENEGKYESAVARTLEEMRTNPIAKEIQSKVEMLQRNASDMEKTLEKIIEAPWGL